MAAHRLPPHPGRICWGCHQYGPVNDLGCGNGRVRTPHPVELFGADWVTWTQETRAKDAVAR